MAKSSIVVLSSNLRYLLIVFGLFFCISSNLYAQKSDFKNIDFTKADSIADLYPNHSLYDLPELASKLTDGLETDVEKFRAIYKWVCSNIENDYSYFLKNQRKRNRFKDKPEKFKQWNQEFAVKAYKRLLKEHQTVCTGYAALVKELSYFAGIETVVVNGYGKTAYNNQITKGLPNHSWNAVKLNDKWYLSDPTWSAGKIYTDKRGFQFEYFDGYFLSEPQLFALNHFSLDKKWLLTESEQSLDDFMQNPIVYRGAFANDLLLEAPQQFALSSKKDSTLRFQLKQINDAPSENLKLVLQINVGERAIETLSDFKSQDANRYIIDYTSNRKGKYIIHLMKGEEYLYSFELVGE